eukprot:SM000009S23560  [mRNA]  locus=s9:718272:721298:+ [translate_table: standard]
MVLEATLVCIDNSEWMRNGDYPPTRFQAQADAVNLICGAKTQSNPENTVGILTMAGKGVRVLVTPTGDLGKILSSMQGLDIGGDMHLTSGVQVAQLALKHRQNKNQRQRIVLFAGSPIMSAKEVLVAMGKKLKKNNVALDIVSFGEEDNGKAEKLEALLAAVNSNDNSHLVHVPSGPNVLSDVLISSPIFTGDGEGGSGFAAAAAAGAAAAAAAGGAGASGAGYDFGVDPNLDPELALALRVSMEEERARQEAAAKRAAEEVAGNGSAKPSAEEPVGDSAQAAYLDNIIKGAWKAATDEQVGQAEKEPAEVEAPMTEAMAPPVGDENLDDQAELLRQALAMSMASTPGALDIAMPDAAGDDTELSLALQMSMQQDTGAATSSADRAITDVLGDADFVNSILSSLPGVDPNDPQVQNVIASLQKSNKGSPEEDTEKKDDGKS